MKKKINSTTKILILTAVFLLLVNVALGFFLMRQSSTALISLMQTRMLDVSNTAAAMLDGDELEALTAKDVGSPEYEKVMNTLYYFRDNIDLKYIYCVQDMGDGTFAFILDTDPDSPGQFGEPVVYTEALKTASTGTPAADAEPYSDEWGTFYSAYSPVFDSKGNIAGIVTVDFSAQWYEEQLAALNRTTIIIAVASLVIGAGIVIVISSRNRKRVQEVDQELNQLANNLTKGMSKEALDELQLLEEHDNTSSGDVEGLTRKIRAIVDVQKHEAQVRQEEMSEALEAAQQASVAKTVFLSNMSHELRTPLNAIIGLDNLALKGEGIPAETREQIEKIGVSAQHLLDIINDILDMSMIESGKMAVQNREFSISGFMDEMNALIETECREKGLNFEYYHEGALRDYYIGDDRKLMQALVNILENAVQYTPAPGTVSLYVETVAEMEEHSNLRFRVVDTGIGMDKEYLPHVFDAFSQEDTDVVHNGGSTGLGLSISRNLIELMNGTISVESEKGKGTTFTVTVPLRNCVHEEESEKQAIQTDNLEGCRILVAEDLEINAEIILDLLELEGMEGEHAENGQIAVDMFLEHEPGYYDAILMDLRMPVMDGLTATRTIRATDREDAKTIPIIAVTANALEEDVQRSLQAGINIHIAKPVDADWLYAALAKLITK